MSTRSARSGADLDVHAEAGRHPEPAVLRPVSIRMPASLAWPTSTSLGHLSLSCNRPRRPSARDASITARPAEKQASAAVCSESPGTAAAPSRRDCPAATTIAGPACPARRLLGSSPSQHGPISPDTARRRASSLVESISSNRVDRPRAREDFERHSLAARCAGCRIQQPLDGDGQHREDRDR